MVPVRRNARDWLAYLAGGGLVLGLVAFLAKRGENKLPRDQIHRNHGGANNTDKVAASLGKLLALSGEDHQNAKAVERQRGISQQALVDRINGTDRWIIGLTAAIALSGIISAVIFGWQLSVMRGQLDEMAGDQRPWLKVVLQPSDLHWLRAGGGPNSIFGETEPAFVVQNVGNFPAFNVKGLIQGRETLLPKWTLRAMLWRSA